MANKKCLIRADAAAADGEGNVFRCGHLEQGKPNELEIGTRLTIGGAGSAAVDSNAPYEDLDEIVARFLTPMLARVQRVDRHKNWRYGGERNSRVLFAEKQQDRSTHTVRAFTFHRKEQPGSFQFSFLPNANVKLRLFIDRHRKDTCITTRSTRRCRS